MTLNPTKSVAILFGTPKRLKSFSSLKSCNVAGTDIQLSDKVKILGATLVSPWNPIPRLYPAPAFIIFDRSSKFVHL